MNSADWKCPVCGFYAENGDEQDAHIKATGHVGQETTEDAGISHPHADTSDMSYSDQVGYAPGASNQVDSSQKKISNQKSTKKINKVDFFFFSQ